MSKILLITESTEYKNYEKYYPNQSIGVATGGHIYQLQKEDGIKFDTLSPVYEWMENKDPKYKDYGTKRELMTKINNYGKQVDKIYILTDQDLEGECIAFCVYDALTKENKDKAIRKAFNDWSKDSIDKNINGKPDVVPVKYKNELSWLPNRDAVGIYTWKVASQQYRAVLDRIFGFGLSNYIRARVPGALSAGRVQSVPLLLLLMREQQIKNFKSVKSVGFDFIIPTQELVVSLTKLNSQYKVPDALYVDEKDKSNKIKFKDENLAKKYLQDYLSKNEFKLVFKTKSEKNIKPEMPFDTMTLNKVVSAKYAWKIAKINDMLQTLYEKGWTTYPRSDSNKIDEDMCHKSIAFLKQQYGTEDLNIQSSPKSYFFNKSNASSQEGHFAVTNVDMSNTPEKMKDIIKQENDSKFDSQELYKLYELIYNRTKLAFFKDAVNDVCKYVFDNNGSEFTGNISNVKYLGWKKYLDEKEEHINKDIDFYSENKIYQASNWNNPTQFKHYETKPPREYTWGTLIDVLKKNQIGRPSTLKLLTSIVEKRGYTTGGDGKTILKLTDLGRKVAIEIATNLKSLINLTFTKEQYEIIDKIQLGENIYYQQLSKFLINLNVLLRTLKQPEFSAKTQNGVKKQAELTDRKCPKCGKPLVKRTAKADASKVFYGCSGFPKCKYVEWPDSDKPTQPIELAPVKCSKCGKAMKVIKYTDKKDGKIKTFYACVDNNCGNKEWPQNYAIEPCPLCGNKVIIREYTDKKTGKKKKAQFCSNKSCNYKKFDV